MCLLVSPRTDIGYITTLMPSKHSCHTCVIPYISGFFYNPCLKVEGCCFSNVFLSIPWSDVVDFFSLFQGISPVLLIKCWSMLNWNLLIISCTCTWLEFLQKMSKSFIYHQALEKKSYMRTYMESFFHSKEHLGVKQWSLIETCSMPRPLLHKTE